MASKLTTILLMENVRGMLNGPMMAQLEGKFGQLNLVGVEPMSPTILKGIAQDCEAAAIVFGAENLIPGDVAAMGASSVLSSMPMRG